MNDVHPDSEVSVTRLVGGILTDAQKLIEQQLALFQREVKDDLYKTAKVGVLLMSGAVTAFVGGVLLCFMLVELLAWAAPDLPIWSCYGIVGSAIISLGGALLFAGIQKFKSIDPMHDHSILALKETFQWKTIPK